MISTKALSELLTQNSDDKLCKSWCLMTPNGTLLAYTQPAAARIIRKLAATAALSWQEHVAAMQSGSMGVNGHGDVKKTTRHLYALSIESDTANVLVRQVQPDLLLVLEGGIPPRRRTSGLLTTAEDSDGELFTIPRELDNVDSSLGTTMSPKPETGSGVSASVLGLHRKRLDAMAEAISAEFARTGFKMPNESVNKLF
nr:hypothetical protein CFP56_32189 [Quercus suber]